MTRLHLSSVIDRAEAIAICAASSTNWLAAPEFRCSIVPRERHGKAVPKKAAKRPRRYKRAARFNHSSRAARGAAAVEYLDRATLSRSKPMNRIKLFFATFCIAILATGCASTGNDITPSDAQLAVVRAGVTSATILLIKGATHSPADAVSRAQRVKAVAREAQTWIDTSVVAIADLPAALRTRVATMNLPAEDVVLASTLVELVAAIAESTPQLEQTADAVQPVATRVNAVLGWIIGAAEAFGV